MYDLKAVIITKKNAALQIYLGAFLNFNRCAWDILTSIINSIGYCYEL